MPTPVADPDHNHQTNHPPTYTISLDGGTTTECTFKDLCSPGTLTSSDPSKTSLPDPFSSLPHQFQCHSKVTLDYNGSFHKGFLSHTPEGGFVFECRCNLWSSKIDWTVHLPDFIQQWTTLMGENVIFPGHTQVSSFLCPSTSNNAPPANYLSAKNLLSPCPPSLIKAPHPSNPDCQVWLDSYHEEKGGLQNMDVFDRISKREYLQLRRQGTIQKALPSMCVLVVKLDKDGKPSRTKSRIVVLGNFEDRYYEKNQKYTPVLRHSALRLLVSKAIEDKRILQQGDCKNTFCQAILPDDEHMAIRPPVGDPAFHSKEYWLLNKTLYGLRRSPHHWYNRFTSILRQLGLQSTPNDPCMFTGSLTSNTLVPLTAPLHAGVYVDDFIFYSTDPNVKALFQSELEIGGAWSIFQFFRWPQYIF